MDIKYFRIIEGLVVTSKSKSMFDKEGKLTLKVDKRANKSEIKRAIEEVWEVKVEKVRTVSVKGKAKRFSGKAFKTQDYKKAIVALKDGYKIDVPWQQYQSGIENVPGEVVSSSSSGEGK